ncbi:MAG: hypothetical protein EB117_13820 [Betaproteobacteria bacterium]|nr:hypothetical protein [Betaproteobacteria bacterium]
MAQAIIGISKADVTASTANAQFRLGTVGGYDDPTNGYQEFVYGRADGAVTGAGYLCVEETGFDFTMVSTTSTTPGTAGPGSRCGAAQAALADNEYGWFQIYGKGSLRTLASAAKGTQLNSTATAGAVDDDATAGSEVIVGVVLLTATGGSAATNTDAVFCYPSVGRTL